MKTDVTGNIPPGLAFLSEGEPPYMPSADEYRALAAECFALAQKATDPTDKNRFIQMAQAWRELADRVARAGPSNDEKGSGAK